MKFKILAIIAVISSFHSVGFSQSNSVGSGIAADVTAGGGEYIDLGDVYNTLDFPVSVEAWVYPTSYDSYSSIISTDNGNVGSYYGFWFRFNSLGNLIFEIGDGSGSGGSDRRGKKTINVVSINKWSHVAVVANSITDITFYINGQEQTEVSTDGSSTVTNILHSANLASLCRQVTPSAEHYYHGKIDEVRLWNISLTELNLRGYMCKKLSGLEAGLLGYWKFDESYLGVSVSDHTVPAENGTLVGAITKITSGAPIGDVSMHTYAATYTGVTMNLNSPGGDIIKVNQIKNLPFGVQLYRVDENPYLTGGLGLHTNYYFGVFTADNAVAAKYSINYIYSYDNGVVDSFNEIGSKIYRRTDGSVPTWSNLSATLDTAANKLIRKNIATRNEFIFNYKANAKWSNIDLNLERGTAEFNIYPQPASDVLNLECELEISLVSIYNMDGQIVYAIEAGNNGTSISISVLNLPNGNYVVFAKLSNGSVASKKIVIAN